MLPRFIRNARVIVTICAVFIPFTDVPARIGGYAKLCAVMLLPSDALSFSMGWERANARRMSVYYRDGFARAHSGRGFK